MVIEHWAEYLIPGSFVSESENKKLINRHVSEAVAKMPNYAFAFELYDVRVRQARLEDGEQFVHRTVENRSGRHYPGGIKYTLDDAIREHGEQSILATNMRINGFTCVKTRSGNYQPLQETDLILVG